MNFSKNIVERRSAHCARKTCLVGLLAAFGCSDPLTERQDIADLRVLGARIEPLAEPSRAEVLPGESARVRWLVAGPRGPVEVRYGLTACASAESSRGIPSCAEPPVTSVVPDEPSGEPTFDLVVPEGARLLVSGVFCTSGDVRLEDAPEGSSCVDADADQEVASYEAPIATDETKDAARNHHPELAGAELTLNGDAWLATDANAPAGTAGAAGASGDVQLTNPCESSDARRVAAGRTVTIGLSLPEAAREPRAKDEAFGSLETLQISHLSTVGDLSRPFTVLQASDAKLESELTWQAPKSGGPAYFYFVVRDLRGGVSWLERSICVND